ncbi:MAG: major facilitator transporter [Puniceicoccaceae bacterium 5H]|nr:MAG: major facilitator transporter [Puniceicoccaceae bacterium 5H]
MAEKIAFGLGMAIPIAFINSVAQLTNLIFNLGLGVSLIWLGVVQMIPRLWDAISDPLTGYLSDNTRTRWGRRRPYIIFGGIVTAFTYVLIWWAPRGWEEGPLLAYYLVVSLCFYTATTVFSVPLTALGYEMSRDYHEKTRLFAIGSFLGNTFAIVTPWMYKLANLDFFESEVEGMRWIAVIVGGVVLITALLPGIICKERRQVDVAHQAHVKFWPSMKSTLRDSVFLRVVGVVFLVTCGFNFVNNFTNYIVIFYVYGGDRAAASTMLGWNGTVWAITGLLAVLPMTWTSERLGKARTVQIFVGLMMGGSFLKILCYNPALPWLTLIPTVFISAGMLALYTMAVSMVADVSNLDELKSGFRREGSYSAVYSWWLKVAVSTGFLVSGFLLDSTGFDDQVVEQAGSTLFWMRFWEIGLPGVLCLIAVFVLQSYPLTEARAYEIKAQLDARSPEDRPVESEA